MYEIIPFAKEMLSEKPTRSMLKLYLVGSMVAVMGIALGLMETVCKPFSSNEPIDAELAQLMAREHSSLEAEEEQRKSKEMEVENQKGAAEHVSKPKKATVVQRNSANRLHAS